MSIPHPGRKADGPLLPLEGNTHTSYLGRESLGRAPSATAPRGDLVYLPASRDG